MLKKFLRWSWLRPLARSILSKHGKDVLVNLLMPFPIPAKTMLKIEQINNLLDDAKHIVPILNDITQILYDLKTNSAYKAAKTLQRIVDLIK